MHVGEETAKSLAKKFQNSSSKINISCLAGFFEKISPEGLREISDIGPKVAQSIHSWFLEEKNRKLLKNLETIFSLSTLLSTPLLMLHGSSDHYCSLSGTRRFYNELVLAQKGLKIYEGMYHELLNEIIKEEVFHDIDGWFQKYS